jgi:crotonobetainyl-CoA:carnitine CoA-transferase CaiB-like acyl-CoA transferase
VSSSPSLGSFVETAYRRAISPAPVPVARDSVEHADDQALRRLLPSRLDVAGLASGSVAELAAATNRYLIASGLRPRTWRLSAERIAASYAGDQLLRRDGEGVPSFAELSGFFRSSDGWVRTHANYPHHRDALCAAFGLGPQAGPSELAHALATRPGHEVEAAAWSHDALAVRVRDAAEWRPSPAPLLSEERGHDAGGRSLRPAVDATLPLAGIRVLDLTRVIAGPVATRALALLGADVLRIDPPQLAELPTIHLDSGQGKRSALVDAKTPGGAATLAELLRGAHVLVTGYRPGSFESMGVALPPGLIHATVDAWGAAPGLAGRRGFDSLVQAATGISLIEADQAAAPAGPPGVLPVQALDHSSGYLLAAAIVDSLASKVERSEGRRVSISLASVAELLLAAGRFDPVTERDPYPDDVVVTHGGISTARPALVEFADYPAPAHPIGGDSPVWNAAG